MRGYTVPEAPRRQTIDVGDIAYNWMVQCLALTDSAAGTQRALVTALSRLIYPTDIELDYKMSAEEIITSIMYKPNLWLTDSSKELIKYGLEITDASDCARWLRSQLPL